MTSIVLPPQITSIKPYAFSRNGTYYAGLTKIDIPSSVEAVEPYAF